MTGQELEDQIKKYLAGKLHGPEKEAMERWLNSEDEDLVVPGIPHVDKEAVLKRLHEQIGTKVHKSRVLQFPVWMKWAASLLIIALAAFYVYQKLEPSQLTAIASGSTSKVLLADGSIVWLKKNSSLSYPEIFGNDERHVELKGEALFEVAKDPQHPFMIHCGDITAKVLGTSFNLKSGESNIELKVLTGKVNLSSISDTKGIDVTPNQKVIYTGNPKVIPTSLTEHEVSLITVSTEYSMSFNHTSMKEIIERVESKFNIDLIIENSKLADCSITADLTDQSLSETMRMLSGALDFQYEILNNTVTVKGGGCQSEQ